MNVCLKVCMCTCVCLVPMEFKENIRFPGTRVTGGCAMLDGSWESNLVLLQEQQVFLPTGSSLHHVHFVVETESLWTGAQQTASWLGIELERCSCLCPQHRCVCHHLGFLPGCGAQTQVLMLTESTFPTEPTQCCILTFHNFC